MDDIFGSAQGVNQDAIDKAPAKATWPVGSITPVFDREEHKTDSWSIGKRKKTPLADGLRLRLKLHDAGLPVVFTLTRDGKEETVKVKGGGTIFFTGYPNTVPKPGEDLKHFHHFYTLLEGNPIGDEPIHGLPTTPYPARCAPALNYPPPNE